MKTLFLTTALLLVPGLALAEPCTWVTSPNSNVLMRTGDCDDGAAGRGGAYFTGTKTNPVTGEIEATYNGRPSERSLAEAEIAAN